MKYYFITYQATNRQGSTSLFHEVTETSPMEFIIDIAQTERAGDDIYINFIIVNTCEITYEEFMKYEEMF